MSRSRDAYKIVFGESLPKETYQMKGHSFSKTIGGKPYCMSCGFIALNNEISRWYTEKGCYADLHPQYKSMLKRLTKF